MKTVITHSLGDDINAATHSDKLRDVIRAFKSLNKNKNRNKGKNVDDAKEVIEIAMDSKATLPEQ